MRFTIDMAWAIGMPKGRTRSAGRYITLPDIGVGACAEHGNPAVLERLEQVSDLPATLDADECRLDPFSIFDLCKALGHALYQLVLRETTQKGVLK